MERQEKAFCLVHAFNMALGQQQLDGKHILDHIRQMEQTLMSRQIQDVDLKKFYTPGIGNFNNMIINHYLSHCHWNEHLPLE